MSSKTPVVISVVLTIILFLILAALTMLMQIVLMNGVMNEGQTTTALGTTLACQGVELILGALFAAWLTRLLVVRFNWNNALAVIVPIVIVIVIGVVLSIISIFVGFGVAGIK